MSRRYLYDGPALILDFNDKILINDRTVSIADENDYLGITFCCTTEGWDLNIWHDTQEIELKAFETVTVMRKNEIVLHFISNGLWFEILSICHLHDYIPYEEMTIEEIEEKIQRYSDE